MKTIKIENKGKFNAVELIKTAVSVSSSGMSLDQMRGRIRVLDAIDAMREGETRLILEDADYTALSEAINAQPWAIADRDLLAVIDNILTPEKPAGLKAA